MINKAQGTGGKRNIVPRLKDASLLAAITLLILLGLEACARAYYHFRPDGEDRETTVRPFGAETDSPWTVRYANEFKESAKTDWQSYVYWRRKPFTGEFINVDSSGLRRTINREPPGSSDINVFVFGGSTVWGPWIRDRYTIPSCLSAAFEQAGYHHVRVTNFGESGYVSTQEVIQFMLELRAGNVPDIAVFYDGVNDVFSAYQNKRAGIPLNESNRTAEFHAFDHVGFLDWLNSSSRLLMGLSRLREKLRRGSGIQASNDPPRTGTESMSAVSRDSLAENTLRQYEGNVKIIEALAREYNVEPFFFWQPALFSKRVISEDERRYADSFDAGLSAFFRIVYSRVTSRTAGQGSFCDLQDVFAGEPGTVFVDYCHIAERWDAVVADAMSRALAARSARMRGRDADRRTGRIGESSSARTVNTLAQE